MLLYWPTLLTCAGADSRCVPETPCSEKLQMRAAPSAYSLSALQSRASKRRHRSECGGQRFVILSTLWVICWGRGRKISSINSSTAHRSLLGWVAFQNCSVQINFFKQIHSPSHPKAVGGKIVNETHKIPHTVYIPVGERDHKQMGKIYIISNRNKC